MCCTACEATDEQLLGSGSEVLQHDDEEEDVSGETALEGGDGLFDEPDEEGNDELSDDVEAKDSMGAKD